ncbi:hypothetical protein N7468_007134 [Penicillium chermesinum]|uniref:C6 zinc finger domain protein n=1 Tax=Penicillium chermesinum TaxID=63820 RepID=A0A9W9NWF3_9EURO|nr:uncharacterized protein N7468_007134 [Penicillium chermesinum]KAJ5225909.1 hypothetical protein N7468_007134 [Penicillium chermesinum]
MVDSAIQRRALEFFFHKTAPHLAGYFESQFFQNTVLQLTLTEPAIRQASAAIGVLHEQTALGALESFKLGLLPITPIQMYNRSIRTILEKGKTDNSYPLIATTNLLFIAFEYFQGNVDAAANHIQSGIKILQAWRTSNGGPPKEPWGKNYQTSQEQFMEVKIALLLSTFNTNAVGYRQGHHTDVFLNPISETGELMFADSFDNVMEARVALIDMISCANSHFYRFNNFRSQGPLDDPHSAAVFENLIKNLDRWQMQLDDLIVRRKASWMKRDRESADAIRIIRISMSFGVRSFLAENECAWDALKPEYEEAIILAERLLADRDRYTPEENRRTLSLDCGIIFSFHALAWKCRWPYLRRRALDAFRRIPKREWLLDMGHYHRIFSRIMELEEDHLNLPPGAVPREDWLPPEHVRIHDFKVVSVPGPPGWPPGYEVTFWSKPQGLHKPWLSLTENMQLGFPSGSGTVPYNMISRKPWTMPELVTYSVRQ